MKSLRNISFLWAMVLLSVISACNKGGGAIEEAPHIIDLNDTVAPVVEIHTPTEGQLFSNGQTISVTGKITDVGGLYRGSIRITNEATTALVKEQLIEIHGFQSYNYNVTHTVAVSTPGNYRVTVSFEDHGLNNTTQSVKVKVNP